MSLNPDLIRARCAEIDASLIRLDQLRHLPRETFLSSQDTLDIACYRLLIAIEAATCWSMSTGRSIMSRCTKSLRHVLMICVHFVPPWLDCCDHYPQLV